MATCLIMGRKKSRPVTCKGCGFLHDLNLDGWVILLSGELICASNQKCWELYRLLAQRWSQHVGVPVSESTVCLMLSDMKIAREIAGKNDEDNIVDLVNYAYLYADLAYKSDDDRVIIDTLSRLNKGD
jgi:hypothetical protein